MNINQWFASRAVILTDHFEKVSSKESINLCLKKRFENVVVVEECAVTT